MLAFASAAMLCLARGWLRLDDPVSKHLPEFTGEGRERITIKHLLLHSSGLQVNLNGTKATLQPNARRGLCAGLPGEAALRARQRLLQQQWRQLRPHRLGLAENQHRHPPAPECDKFPDEIRQFERKWCTRPTTLPVAQTTLSSGSCTGILTSRRGRALSRWRGWR